MLVCKMMVCPSQSVCPYLIAKAPLLRATIAMNMICIAALILALAASGTANAQSTVLVEAEAFEDLDGWVLDQQFMDLMGSPYLLAHGIGVPVVDVTTTVGFPVADVYRVWVRTRDWVGVQSSSFCCSRCWWQLKC